MIARISSTNRCFLAFVVCIAVCCGNDEDPSDELGVADAGTEDLGTPDVGGVSDAEPLPDAGSEIPLATARALDAAELNRGAWTWIPVEGARCRDGSETGFLIRLQRDARDLMVYFQGGGACFNEGTCGANPAAFSGQQGEALSSALGRGIFDDTDPDNPVAEWNMAFFPYCTGDVFMGSNPSVMVPEVGAQDFVGALNVEAFADLLAGRYAPTTEHLLVTGSSAGGFGAALNFPALADRFPRAQTDLLNDSGPLLPFGDASAPCLLQQWLDLWGGSITTLCPDCSATEDGLFGWARYLSETYPGSRLTLASYTEDSVIRSFFGFGEDACTPRRVVRPISGDVFSAALLEFRRGRPEWGSFYVEGASHTFLVAATTYDAPLVDDTSLESVLGQLLRGEVQDIGP